MLTQSDKERHMHRHPFRVLTGALVFLVACAWPLSAPAQELCGIDSIFANGFQTDTSNPALTTTPGAIVSPGVATSITMPATITVSAAYPANGATVDGTTTDVAGTFVGPTDTGITVNGVIAYADGGKFLAAGVPLQAGSNSLTISATTLTGQTASAAPLSVTQGALVPTLALNIVRRIGYAPFMVHFSVNVGALPDGGAVQTLSIDYDGDGTDDVVNPAPGAALTFLAQQPNLYTARLTVVSTNSNTYTAYTRYMVQDFTRQSGMLCDVYGYMKQRLAAQDSAGALTAIGLNAQDEYQSLFFNNASTLPAYVASLGNIVDGYIDGRTGTFIVVRQNPDLSLSGFHMEFSQNADGTWRIAGM